MFDVLQGVFWGYWSDIFKAFACAFAQISTIIVLYTITLDQSDKGWCDGEGENTSRIMAISYTLILSTAFYNIYDNNQNSGFYLHLEYESKDNNFISSSWLHFGRIINGLVVINCVYLSFLVILFSDDPFDIILNSIALLFIADIDNMVIDHDDYEKTLQFFQNEENVKKFERTPQKGCKKVFWNGLYFTVSLNGYLSILVMMFMPVVIGICY